MRSRGCTPYHVGISGIIRRGGGEAGVCSHLLPCRVMPSAMLEHSTTMPLPNTDTTLLNSAASKLVSFIKYFILSNNRKQTKMPPALHLPVPDYTLSFTAFLSPCTRCTALSKPVSLSSLRGETLAFTSGQPVPHFLQQQWLAQGCAQTRALYSVLDHQTWTSEDGKTAGASCGDWSWSHAGGRANRWAVARLLLNCLAWIQLYFNLQLNFSATGTNESPFETALVSCSVPCDQKSPIHP